MTITGVNVTVALSVLAAVGDIERFSSWEKLVSHFGLNPRVRQSGDKPAYHGRITRQGRAHARSMLVEAAWVISGVPGRCAPFFMRIRDKRGKHVAVVATTHKLAVIVWHTLTKDEDYTWSRSALLDRKLRKLELTAGYPSRRGGSAEKSCFGRIRCLCPGATPHQKLVGLHLCNVANSDETSAEDKDVPDWFPGREADCNALDWLRQWVAPSVPSDDCG